YRSVGHPREGVRIPRTNFHNTLGRSNFPSPANSKIFEYYKQIDPIHNRCSKLDSRTDPADSTWSRTFHRPPARTSYKWGRLDFPAPHRYKTNPQHNMQGR